MGVGKKYCNFSDVRNECIRFRALLEEPELGLGDEQLGRLIKALRPLRCAVEMLRSDIPFAKIRSVLWEREDTLKDLLRIPDLSITDRDCNGLDGEEAKEYVKGEIEQLRVLMKMCEKCGELE